MHSEDWADAQTDLSLRWAHTHFVGFVMTVAHITERLEESRYFEYLYKFRHSAAHLHIKLLLMLFVLDIFFCSDLMPITVKTT